MLKKFFNYSVFLMFISDEVSLLGAVISKFVKRVFNGISVGPLFALDFNQLKFQHNTYALGFIQRTNENVDFQKRCRNLQSSKISNRHHVAGVRTSPSD